MSALILYSNPMSRGRIARWMLEEIGQPCRVEYLDDGTSIAGDRFSAADVYAGSQIGYGLRFDTIPARPAFGTYWAGIAQRPALLRAGELDDAAIAARG